MTLALALLSAAVFEQQVRTFYTTADGLPSDDVTAVIAGPDGRAYARTARGAARLEEKRWVAGAGTPMIKRRTVELPARDGLPVDGITAVEQAADGSYWIGTSKGAIRYDGKNWEYRQGLRWLPDDHVRSVAVVGNRAYFATAKGIGVIETIPMTFAAKARHFEEEIDKRHRRTEYGYVLGVHVDRPGDAGAWRQTDSDNDGLWTSMYGAGECFACAAGIEPACLRAKKVFEALRFLGTVTQGGPNAPPKGFVARTVLPASGPDPNLTYTPEADARMRATRDRLWKILRPRWPRSADGKWYWKADTSSDELDGHYFFYGLYFDLVPKSEAETQALRDQVAALTDHLADHGFQLIDHDGAPTRWGIFDPANLNHNPLWHEERGLNSLSMLSYLKVAGHITGNPRYEEAARRLRDQHAYHINTLIPKGHRGPGFGNQSDDEMAFMCFYHLLRYETDPRLRMIYGRALRNRWENEAPERNPLFHFIAAAALKGLIWEDSHSREPLDPEGDWLEDSLDTLRRYPLDRFNWPMQNSHRKDLILLRGSRTRGMRRDGKVLPIDERFVEHWNHDPWQLDSNGDGRRLADGASYLLPYYMGLYHRFLTD